MSDQQIKDMFDKMVSDHNNKPWEVEDSSNLDQCFDLALGWCDILAIPREAIRHPNASEIWTKPLDSTLQYFDYIPNTPNGVPHKGDIVIFSGVVGHVSVSSGQGDSNIFVSFDQNWDTPNYHDAQGHPICRYVTHDYRQVLGFLRPKRAPLAPTAPPVAVTDQTKIPASLLNSADYPVTTDMEIQALRGTLGDYGKYRRSHPELTTTPEITPKTASSDPMPQIVTITTPSPVIDTNIDPNPVLSELWSWFRALFPKKS